jgi:hypothetical protein
MPIQNSNQKDADDDDDNNRSLISNLLVCGDGDLSYSASIAPHLSQLGIHFIASVLEEQSMHNEGTLKSHLSIENKSINHLHVARLSYLHRHTHKRQTSLI